MSEPLLKTTRLFLTLSYLGTRYHGWQTQKQGEVTIQGLIQDTLETLTGERVGVTASGRTDAGVHAEGQVAHLTLPSSFPSDKLQGALNALLPHDIRVMDAVPVTPNAHARRDAVSKTYRYQIFTGPVLSPFLAQTHWHITVPLAFERIEEAMMLLQGTRDFAAFATGAHLYATTVRALYGTKVRRDGPLLMLTFTGSGFMRHMVRRIVGAVLEVARGKEPFDWFRDLVEGAPPAAAGPTAPARGLILERVEYSAIQTLT